MTSYYFDLVEDGGHYIDAEGTMFGDDQAAVTEARGILGDILRQGLDSKFDLARRGELSVVVRTLDAGTVATVSLSLSVDVRPH